MAWVVEYNAEPAGGNVWTNQIPVFPSNVGLCGRDKEVCFEIWAIANGQNTEFAFIVTAGTIKNVDNCWVMEYIDGDHLIIDYPPENSKPEKLEDFPSNLRKILIHPGDHELCKDGITMKFRLSKYYYPNGDKTDEMLVAKLIS
jgi:hypothetical protein